MHHHSRREAIARMAGLVLAGTALGACAPMQGTQSTWPVRRPVPVVGARWRYQVRTGVGAAVSRRFEDRIVSLTDRECEIEQTLLPPDAGGSGKSEVRRIGAGVWWHATTIFAGLESGMREHWLRFPLQPGQRWAHSHWGSTGGLTLVRNEYHWATTVGESERVQVPAGSFEAVGIVHEGIQYVVDPAMHFGTEHYVVTLWYAPQVQHVVKVDVARQNYKPDPDNPKQMVQGMMVGSMLFSSIFASRPRPPSPKPIADLRDLFPKAKPPVTETTELMAWSRP